MKLKFKVNHYNDFWLYPISTFAWHIQFYLVRPISASSMQGVPTAMR